MQYRIEIRPEAHEDLKSIEDWSLLNFGWETALKTLDGLFRGMSRLKEFPDSGSLTPDKMLNEAGYRMVIVGRHVIIYKVIGETVFVYRVLDTRRQYTRLFYE